MVSDSVHFFVSGFFSSAYFKDSFLLFCVAVVASFLIADYYFYCMDLPNFFIFVLLLNI